ERVLVRRARSDERSRHDRQPPDFPLRYGALDRHGGGLADDGVVGRTPAASGGFPGQGHRRPDLLLLRRQPLDAVADASDGMRSGSRRSGRRLGREKPAPSSPLPHSGPPAAGAAAAAAPAGSKVSAEPTY